MCGATVKLISEHTPINNLVSGKVRSDSATDQLYILLTLIGTGLLHGWSVLIRACLEPEMKSVGTLRVLALLQESSNKKK